MLKWIVWPFWNAEERRLRALWRLVLFVAALSAAGWLGKRAGLLDVSAENAFLVASSFRLVATSLVLLVMVPFVDRRPLSDLGFTRERPFWPEMLVGAAIGALGMSAIFFGERAMGWLEIAGSLQAEPGHSFGASFLRALALFVVAGTWEELLFRAWLLRTLAQGLRGLARSPGAALWLACVLSSGFFGYGHYQNPNATVVSSAAVGLAGILLSLGYMYTGRLALPIGLHIAWNLFQGTVYGFPVSGNQFPAALVVIRQGGPQAWTGGAFGPEAGIVGLLAMAAGSAAIVGYLRWRDRGVHAAARLVEPILRAPLPAAPAEPPALAEAPPAV